MTLHNTTQIKWATVDQQLFSLPRQLAHAKGGLIIFISSRDAYLIEIGGELIPEINFLTSRYIEYHVPVLYFIVDHCHGSRIDIRTLHQHLKRIIRQVVIAALKLGLDLCDILKRLGIDPHTADMQLLVVGAQLHQARNTRHLTSRTPADHNRVAFAQLQGSCDIKPMGRRQYAVAANLIAVHIDTRRKQRTLQIEEYTLLLPNARHIDRTAKTDAVTLDTQCPRQCDLTGIAGRIGCSIFP